MIFPDRVFGEDAVRALDVEDERAVLVVRDENAERPAPRDRRRALLVLGSRRDGGLRP